MTLYIHTPANAPTVYPYTLADLRADNPNVSFPNDPDPADLVAFDVFPVEPSERPADTREQRAEEAQPEQDEAGTWRQVWTMRDATADELAAWDAAHAPAPDWPTFRALALTSPQLDGVLVAAQQAAPTAALALGAALLAAEGNGCEPFAQAWARVVAAVPVPPQLIAGFQAQAQACNLPAAFVAALDPSTEQP